jgi:UDP-glucose 4-epimerase
MNEEKKKILILGIRGGLAQILARLILKKYPHYEVTGVDSRDTKDCPKLEGLTCRTMKYSRGNFEKLFRDSEFDYVYHLARMSHGITKGQDFVKRLELSVMGTNRILDLSKRFNVKKLIILSTFHVYGAISDNSVFLSEDAPLRASIKYSELRDVIDMDQICTNWMWQHQNEIETVVLRPCNIIGNQINNSMTKYLQGPMVLGPMDYNPMFQFIHEFDMATVLLESLEKVPTGTYNVATDDFLPINEAIETVGSKRVPFPMSLAEYVNNALKVGNLEVPNYFIDYLKFSCLIDNKRIKKHLGPKFWRFDIKDALKLLNLR